MQVVVLRFHTMMELYKKRGTLFEHTHLRNVFKMTRESQGAQDFVLNPGDPNQAESEYIKIHLAIHLNALRKLIYIKQKNLNADDLFDKDFADYEDEDKDEINHEEDDDNNRLDY